MAVHTLVKIVIPLYRLPLSQAEETAIKHTARILQSYPICFIIPEGLPKAPLERLIPQAGIMSVSNHWLGRENGISGYNDMMMSKDFYSLFADTEYILVCQPDAWIFRDELEKWCRKSYDYIGAPWIRPEKYDRFLPQLWLRLQKIFRHTDISRQDLFDKVGNGGLSLRRINSFIEACERYENEIIRFRKHCHHHYNEDVFWAIIPRNFKYPTAQEALGFAFDEKPELCYDRNGQKLPFGCHGWSKERLYPFWKPFIPASPHS